MVNFDEKQEFALARDTMIRKHLKGRDITDAAVLEAMASADRHRFISEKYLPQAYGDGPLPIGIGQTISQPYIVALMTQELKITPDCDVLEIGTGSGYQTAILAAIAKKVYTIERYNQLAESAQSVLGKLGIENIEFYIGDGSCSWPGEKKFDRILITAATEKIPPPLIEQLKDGGKLIAPVGGRFSQELVRYEKEQGHLRSKTICHCRFVPLIGKYGFESED
jgi:protein-L-isoaspartate(D-aspartate) O-methyltransferase